LTYQVEYTKELKEERKLAGIFRLGFCVRISSLSVKFNNLKKFGEGEMTSILFYFDNKVQLEDDFEEV
jgi:hypothetical protein